MGASKNHRPSPVHQRQCVCDRQNLGRRGGGLDEIVREEEGDDSELDGIVSEGPESHPWTILAGGRVDLTLDI